MDEDIEQLEKIIKETGEGTLELPDTLASTQKPAGPPKTLLDEVVSSE